jgi:hypothetical protein
MVAKREKSLLLLGAYVSYQLFCPHPLITYCKIKPTALLCKPLTSSSMSHSYFMKSFHTYFTQPNLSKMSKPLQNASLFHFVKA